MAPEKHVMVMRPAAAYSATVSSLVQAAARGAVMSRFPAGYFKTVHVSSSQTAARLERVKVPNPPKPRLAVTPRWDSFPEPYFQPKDANLATQQFLQRPLSRFYRPVATWSGDLEAGLYCVPTRQKVEFEFIIVVESEMQAMDVSHYLRNAMRPGEYFYARNAAMEAFLPGAAVLRLSEEMGLDLSDPAGLEAFRASLREASGGQADRKVRLAEGREMWAWEYRTDVLLQMQDAPRVELQRTEKSKDSQKIGFTVSAEAWAPAKWALEIPASPSRLAGQWSEPDGAEVAGAGADFLVTMTVSSADPPRSVGGKFIVDAIGFVAEATGEFESLSLEGYAPRELERAIRIASERGLDHSGYFAAAVWREGGVALREGEDWTMDWERLRVVLGAPVQGAAHVVALYADLDRVNAELLGEPRETDETPEGRDWEPVDVRVSRRKRPRADSASAGS